MVSADVFFEILAGKIYLYGKGFADILKCIRMCRITSLHERSSVNGDVMSEKKSMVTEIQSYEL